MITRQHAANKSIEATRAPSARASAAGFDVGSRLKRRIDTRCEDYAHQLEAERSDLVSVAVLGYN